jgi:hypothetical protein
MSFAKLWCGNFGETQWERKYPLPVSSTKKYFKMQSVHGSSVYRMIPSAQYKLQQSWGDCQGRRASTLTTLMIITVGIGIVVVVAALVVVIVMAA